MRRPPLGGNTVLGRKRRRRTSGFFFRMCVEVCAVHLITGGTGRGRRFVPTEPVVRGKANGRNICLALKRANHNIRVVASLWMRGRWEVAGVRVCVCATNEKHPGCACVCAVRGRLAVQRVRAPVRHKRAGTRVCVCSRREGAGMRTCVRGREKEAGSACVWKFAHSA
jgi:hypothetical protein